MCKIDQIICGDCLEILPTIEDNSIDLCISDPPYGISYLSNHQNTCGRSGIDINTGENPYFDKIMNDDFLPTKWLKEAYRVLKDNTAIYVFAHWKTFGRLQEEAEKVGFNIKNMIVLNKSNWGMGDISGSYAPQHELLLFATKGRLNLKWSKRRSDVWNVPILYSGSYRNHPNEKPLNWYRDCILDASNENDLVLDPFCGSGSCLVECQNQNRHFIGIEIDEKYCEIAKDRLEKAKRIDLFRFQ